MGLNFISTRLMLRAKRQGVNFKNTITLGRQGLYMRKSLLAKNLIDYNYKDFDIDMIFSKEQGFADLFFNLLGAEKVDSIDASDYEGANIIHDMNTPISESLKKKYEVVLDGGSLEHIFNFPIALKNSMEMVALNGHFISISPTNNYWGHGFYQLSPELYFRSLAEENGFKIKEVLFFKHSKNSYDQNKSSVFRLKDPVKIKRRIEMVNSVPICLFIVAQRIAIKPIFEQFPQQIDYEQISWKKERDKKDKEKKRVFNFFKKSTPDFLKEIRRKYILTSRIYGNGKKKNFEKISI